MARKKNPLLRTLVPLAAILLGGGVVLAVAVNSSNQPRGQAATRGEAPAAQSEDRTREAADRAPDMPRAAGTADPGHGPTSPASPDSPVLTDSTRTQPDSLPPDPGQPDPERSEPTRSAPSEPPGSAPVEGARSWRARVFDLVPPARSIGSLDGEGGHKLRLEFSSYGAGIASLQLGEGYFETLGGTDHVELQAQRSVSRPGQADLTAIPFAALVLSVEGRPGFINIAAPGVWRPVDASPGTFEAFIEDASGEAVLRLVRRFELVPGTFRVVITRQTQNLTDRPLTVRWYESAQIDLPEPGSKYGGDKRRVRFGYLLNPRMQAGSDTVTADSELRGRHKVLGDRDPDDRGYKRYKDEQPIWPTPATLDKGHRLAWSAFTSRYFGVAMHPVFDPDTVQPGGEEKLFTQTERLDRLVLNPYIADAIEAVMLVRVTNTPETITPGGRSTVRTGLYAGPLLEAELNADPLTRSLNLQGMVVYNFGGWCGDLCTFGWLTHVLMYVLRAAHALTHDWAASIIILVLIVRTVLHPITRWSQIRLQRFGKQMQEIAPKQQKLREKYKDDPKRMQEEMARLWKEEGINPAGALGCLPMFLQSPVWIALYASLYFAAEMRHEPAFWGVFQAISGGHWRFLADLSNPDAALPLPSFMHFTPPLLGSLYGRIESVNLLPILMAVLFYLHQKYLSPPPSASMTPEQEQQQKIMRIMFPIMMPIFMYPAPSGLVVYFITNSALAIIENKHIRSSAEKKGLLDLELIKAERAAKRAAASGGGFLSRMQQMAEQQQQLKQQGGKASAKPGAKKVQNVAKPEPPKRNYKRRK